MDRGAWEAIVHGVMHDTTEQSSIRVDLLECKDPELEVGRKEGRKGGRDNGKKKGNMGI